MTSDGLFTEMPGNAQSKLPAKAIAGRSKSVKINHGQLRSGRLLLNLPGDISLDAVRDLQKEMGHNKFAWVGHANGDKSNRVVIGVSGNAVAGTFAYEGRLFKLEPRPDGSHVVSEVEPGDPAPEMDPIPVDADTSGATTEQGGTTAADGGTVIDVLVAYTPQVQSIYGSQGAEALIVQAVAEANQAYANSGITPRLNLVHTAFANYTESGNTSTDLGRLRSTSDGYIDELHQLRDNYGADLVSLITVDSQYCGMAYRMTSASSSFASSAFSIVDHACATGYYSFAHELGHNQGAHHDPANASGAIYPHAYGHQDPAGAFRTVMAYNCSGSCTRVDHFSNPAILRNGLPTGVVGYSDNALTLNTTAATVASFRQLPSQFPPSAPYGLQAATSSHSAIALNWVDASSDESGFRLERSEDGLNFVEVASLPANTVAYQDENLNADTLYTYRVSAWNSAGDSVFSDLAVAATDAPPPLTDQVASADLPVAGTVSGNYSSTWSDDGTVQTIQERQSGGKRNRRYGYLEHKWSFQVQAGDSTSLFADVQTSASSDSFTFAYSSNNSQFVDMFSVSAGSSGAKQFSLPPGLSGTVYIRVRDNVRNAGDVSSHSLQVDHLMIRSENGATMPLPTAPEALFATANGSAGITLEWLDTSSSEYGFAIDRMVDGSNLWERITTTGANTTSHSDTGLQADTVYHYRVLAFNSSGNSDLSNTALAQTEAEEAVSANLNLNARAYKTRGRQSVDLSWSGAQGSAMDIYRDGNRIASSVSNTGRHTDNIGVKGGGNYQYEICEASSGACSNSANAVF